MNGAQEQDKTIVLSELLKKNLSIPSYQRAYEWEKKNVFTLLDDIYKYYLEDRTTNLGAIIVHKDKDKDRYEIVDGQQRLITLSLLLRALDFSYDNDLLKNKILCTDNVEARIVKNYQSIKDFLRLISKDESWNQEKFSNYIKQRICFYILAAKTRDEAFQLFDGRNSKYKDLTPIDLLKAYHLGVIGDADKYEMRDILEPWHKNINDPFSIDDSCNKVEYLFNHVLFNIYNWSLNKETRDFTKEDIYLYKGYKENDAYPYVDYCRKNNSFQVNKPFKAGEGFFKMIEKYVKDLEIIIENRGLKTKLPPEVTEGDIFDYRLRRINYLYYSAMLTFFDRFGDQIKPYYAEMVEEFIFNYCVVLRVNKGVIGVSQLNKYVLDPRETKYNFFFECNNALDVEELLKLENAEFDMTINEKERVADMRRELRDCLIKRKVTS